ncbi:MAG: ChaN family lipoprotein [Thermodesulfobacteriota bacterium]
MTPDSLIKQSSSSSPDFGNGIRVIATNVRRRAAAAVAMANRTSPKVIGEDRLFLPRKVHLDSKEYHKRFAASVEEMPHHTPMKGMNFNGLYKAQVLKDAVMAASLESYLDRRILFCCGHFHSEDHLGIPYQLRKHNPELKGVVITFSSAVEHRPMKDRSGVADFIGLEN